MNRRSAGMKSQEGLIYLVLLLALCCLLIPREGESAGGIVALSNAGNETPDQPLDGPENAQGVVVDPRGHGSRYPKVPLQTGKERILLFIQRYWFFTKENHQYPLLTAAEMRQERTIWVKPQRKNQTSCRQIFMLLTSF